MDGSIQAPGTIVKVSVTRMWETCKRTTYTVTLTNDEGFTITPMAYQTGSVYNNFEGLSVEEARERALSDALQWADFLRLEVTPFFENGILYEAEWQDKPYTIRRELRAEQLAETKKG